MGASGNNVQKPTVERKHYYYNNSQYTNNDENITKKSPDKQLYMDLKLILFLLIQQKEIKNNQNNYEEKNFYLVNKTLEKLNQKYNIDNIFDYMNVYINRYSLKHKIDWNKTVQGLIGYCQIFHDELNDKKDNQNIDKIQEGIRYYNSYNIEYPDNFSLIEAQFLSEFLNISNLNKQNYKGLKKGYIIKLDSKKQDSNDKESNISYILLNYSKIHNDDIYLGISLEKFFFKVDFIFFGQIENNINKFINLAIEQIKHNKNKIKQKNTKLKIEQNIEMICYPDNIGNDDYIFNEKIFNQIMYYFSIDKMYNHFISSFKDIENHTLKENDIDIKHIKKIIINQKKMLNENLVFLFDAKFFKENILDDIFYYFQYNLYCSKDSNEKKKLIENIFSDKNEKIKNGNDNDNLKEILKCITYDDIVFDNKKISLINAEIYQKIFKEPEINYMNIDVNLIKINNEFYIYFHKIKKLAKLINKEKNKYSLHDDNIFSILLLNKEDEISKKKISEDFNISQNIIKKLFLISQQRSELNNILEEKAIIELEDYSLINRKWFQKYKEHYKYLSILEKLNNISFSGNNYNEFKKYLNSIDKKNFENDNLNLKCGNFPDALKNPENVFPKINKYYSYEFPNEFDIIKIDLFQSLMEEEDPNDSYNINININQQKRYRILLGNQLTILIDETNNNLLIYYIESQKGRKFYKPKYVLDFVNSEILKDQIQNIKKTDNIENYISNLGADINQDKVQEIKVGKFSLLKIKRPILTIKSFNFPPLIGLENVGATCYMNATLQCFSNVNILTEYFFAHEYDIKESDKDYTLADEYLKLLLNLWNINIDNNKRFYAPYDFKKRLGEKNSLFEGVAANDSKDLILFILEELHKDLNDINNNLNEHNNNANQLYDQFNNGNNNFINMNQSENILYNEFITDYNSKNNSIIKDIFYGVQESMTVCLNCQTRLYSFSMINLLIFPLEKVRQFLLQYFPNNYFPYVTLENCFQHYIAAENLIGQNKLYCNNCKLECNAQTYNIIYRHPKVLIIILNRGQGLQFNVPFNYPMNFLLNNFINRNNNVNYLDLNKNLEYELISVITHMGGSDESGHFIACAKSPVDQKWYLYNDASVSQCGNPLNIFGSATTSSIPYVLFYQLKE